MAKRQLQNARALQHRKQDSATTHYNGQPKLSADL